MNNEKHMTIAVDAIRAAINARHTVDTALHDGFHACRGDVNRPTGPHWADVPRLTAAEWREVSEFIRRDYARFTTLQLYP